MFYSQIIWEHSCSHLSSRLDVVMKYFQFLEKQILVSIQGIFCFARPSAQSDMFFMWPELGEHKETPIPKCCNHEELLNLKTVLRLKLACIRLS